MLDHPDAAQKLVLADHRPQRLNQRCRHVEDGPLTAGPKQLNSTIVGGVGEENHGR
jgi:hypothetical protein